MRKKTQAVSLSIVIPVFNDERHLKHCLESIAAQTVMPSKVIVVDNNSTDSSAKIARQYPFVRVVHEKQQGVVFARNKGFDVADTDLIGRIDADTQLPPEWVDRVLAIFEQTDVAAVSGPVGWYDAPAKSFGMFMDKSIRRITWRLGSKDDAVFLFGSNMALRRNSWQKVRDGVCTDKNVHEDIDLAIHLLRADLPVAFDDSLYAMTSSRRINDPHKQLKKYVDIYQNTYRVHGIKTTSTWPAVIIPLVAHFGIKLIKRGYDPETGQFSLKRFVDNDISPRVHPMG